MWVQGRVATRVSHYGQSNIRQMSRLDCVGGLGFG